MPETPKRKRSNQRSVANISELKEAELGAIANHIAEKHKGIIADHTAQKLVSQPLFQHKIVLRIVLVAILSGLVGIGILVVIGKWVASKAQEEVAATQLIVSNSLHQARVEMTNQIASHFQLPLVKKVVSDVASNNASLLLNEQVLPSVESFRKSCRRKLAKRRIRLQTQYQALPI